MKRKGNLYENIYDFNNIVSSYNEVCRNTKNKRKVAILKEYKGIYISRIHNILKSKSYMPGKYNVFTIYEPKERRIVSQNMQDKLVNHLVARFILYPAILPCLLDVNVASRKGLGTREGLALATEFHRICKVKYGTYYILKCDISKFFASIDHDILKEKIKRKIKKKMFLYKNEKTNLCGVVSTLTGRTPLLGVFVPLLEFHKLLLFTLPLFTLRKPQLALLEFAFTYGDASQSTMPYY